MFNFVEKPWGHDPELNITRCADHLRETIQQIRADSGSLPLWADALAEIADTRAAELGMAPEDYLRVIESVGSAVRVESAQLGRDATIASSVEKTAGEDTSRHMAHCIARCALHLANTHSIKIGLAKMQPGDDGFDRIKIVYDTSVELSLRLYALTRRKTKSEAEAALRLFRDWLDDFAQHI